MRHNLSLSGQSLRLRPVGDKEAAFIVELRLARNKYLHPGAQTEAEQLRWLAEYYGRPDDYYFVAERLRDGQREGLIGIYEIDEKTRQAELGRWVMRKGSTTAAECIWLLYTIAFTQLNLEAVNTSTIVNNKQTVSFHKSCGAKIVEVRKNAYFFNDEAHDAVVQRITRESWEIISPRLRRLAERRAVCRC